MYTYYTAFVHTHAFDSAFFAFRKLARKTRPDRVRGVARFFSVMTNV